MRREVLVEVHAGSKVEFRALFSGISPAQLHVDAVLQGDAEGRLYVDSRESPVAGCLLAGDACYLVGRSARGRFFDAVNELLPRDRYTAVFAGAEVAAADLERATRRLYMLPARRRAATLGRAPHDVWSAPSGVDVVSIDRRWLEDDVPGVGDVRDAATEEWGTVETFLERGFGSAAIADGRVVAHSISDYIVGEACEISIHVVPEHRRQGVGTATAAATVRAAFGRGLARAGWHSWASNAGSIAVSRRVGFSDELFYTVLINHWAAENVTDLSAEEFRAFGETYERMLAESAPAMSGYPHVVAATAFACAGDRAGCLRNLHQAVDVGWLRSLGQLRELWPELFLDPTLPERAPEWGVLFARLER